MGDNKDFLLLKWGSIKGYCLENNPEVFELMKKYYEEGVSMSAALQKDTPSQKELICKMIDAMNGEISNDWDGTIYENKEDAKKYVMEYGRKP